MNAVTKSLHRVRTMTFAVAARLLSSVPTSLGLSAGRYDATWFTIDGGGEMSSTGGAYELAGTIGQPVASSFAMPMTGGGVTFSASRGGPG